MKLSSIIKNVDQLLEKSRLEKDVIISEGLTVRIKTLTNEDIIGAKKNIPDAARGDIVLYSSIESLELLSRSIVSINGVNLLEAAISEIDGDSKESPDALVRIALFEFLNKLPPSHSNAIVEEYNSLTNDLYKTVGDRFEKKIENF